jgi:hypothetical protein
MDSEAVRHERYIFHMQGGKNWIFPKEMNANRFFWDSYWLEIWSNHFCPSMGPNGGIVAIDSGLSVDGIRSEPVIVPLSQEWSNSGCGHWIPFFSIDSCFI